MDCKNLDLILYADDENEEENVNSSKLFEANKSELCESSKNFDYIKAPTNVLHTSDLVEKENNKSLVKKVKNPKALSLKIPSRVFLNKACFPTSLSSQSAQPFSSSLNVVTNSSVAINSSSVLSSSNNFVKFLFEKLKSSTNLCFKHVLLLKGNLFQIFLFIDMYKVTIY